MSRRRRSSDAEITLFPFLAVLICTMGSLIVLLVVVVQQAGREPAPEILAAAPAPEELAVETERNLDLQQQHDDLSWQAEILTESRAKTQRRLQQQHAELSRAEDQARRLKDQLDKLYERSKLIQASYDQQLQDQDQTQRQRDVLQSQIQTAHQALASLQKDREKRARQFALLPYEGPNGTRRKPIYIECHGDHVVLQPEGIELSPDDFQGAVGNNNALANIVRAIREYYVNQGIVKNATEPYPLIIVRPDGASAYSACRSALRAWDDEFGYELVPYEIELAYPKRDPQLRELIKRVLEETRWQQESAAAIGGLPGRAGGLSRPGDVSGRRLGGATPNGSGRDFAGPGGGKPGRNARSRGGSRSVDLALGYSRATNNERSKTSPRSPTAGRQGTGGEGGPGNGPAKDNGPANGNGRSPSGRGDGDSVSNAGGPGGPSSQPGGLSTKPGGSGQGMGHQPNSQASPTASSAAGASAVSIAKSQGANWAVPGAAQGSIGIQRPVVVVCRPAALEIAPESGIANEPIVIPIQTNMAASVRSLVSALWDRVDSWGMAGPGTFWRPRIEVNVASGAETQFAELSALLEDSGLELTRKQEP